MKGKCYYCNKQLTEKTIKRHVKECKDRKNKIQETVTNSKKTKSQFILSITSIYESNDYCLYIAADMDLTLENLDSFLRDIWLECCGHLSSFNIDGVDYDSSVDAESEFFAENETMNYKLHQVISVGDKFKYCYDFGSTTTLKLEVVAEYEAGVNHNQIEILARNEEVQNFCSQCNKKAKYFDYEEGKFFCEECISEEQDIVDEFEYTNSPRDHVCGYAGEKDAEIKYLPGNKFKFKKTKIKRDVIPYIGNNEFDMDDQEDNFEPILNSAMEDINLEIANKADKLLSRIRRGIFTHDLRKLLNCNTKAELLDMAFMLDITKVSQFNKGQLIDRIYHEYEGKMTEALNSIDIERYEFLKKMAENQGYISFLDDDFTSNPEYFLEMGFAFVAMEGESVFLIIPTEMINIIKSLDNEQYREILSKNTEVVKLFWGMTYNYGVLFVSDFTRILTNYVDYHLEGKNLYDIIQSGSDYYGEYFLQGYFGFGVMVEMEDMISIISTRDTVSSDRDFCIINKNELLEAADDKYLIENKTTLRLKKYLKDNWKISDTHVEMMIINLYVDIQANEEQEVVKNILKGIGNEDKNKIQKLIVEINRFINNTRLWRLKGYTLNELNSEGNNNTAPKTGRNDPCICGSDKKFKDCCGAKVINLF